MARNCLNCSKNLEFVDTEEGCKVVNCETDEIVAYICMTCIKEANSRIERKRGGNDEQKEKK